MNLINLQRTMEALAQGFSCEHCEVFKNNFFVEHLQLMPVAKLELSEITKNSVLAIFNNT